MCVCVCVCFSREACQTNQNFGGKKRGENKCQVTVQYVSFCRWNVLISYKLFSFLLRRWAIVCSRWDRDRWDSAVEGMWGRTSLHSAGALSRKKQVVAKTVAHWNGAPHAKGGTPSPASDAINRLVVKAVAVALTFPVTAEIYWFVNHLPKDLNEESFPNGGEKKTFSWLMSVGFWCENMSVKISAHQSTSDAVTAGAAFSDSEQIFNRVTGWQLLVRMSRCTRPPRSLACWLCGDRNTCSYCACVPHVKSNAFNRAVAKLFRASCK